MKIGVIGSGSWGTALALLAHRAGHQVTIYSRSQEITNEINQLHQNQKYLPNIDLPIDLLATPDLQMIVNSDILLLVTPVQEVRAICKKLTPSKDTILVVCSKGIEQESAKLMTEVIEEFLPRNPIAVLSGPNFALPIAQNLPAITSIAAANLDLAQKLAKALASNNFRIYPNDDIIGTQIFAAAKNVLAIATGIVMGKELGENAKAAILSRGICEINALSVAKGGKMNSLLSPAAIGDLSLTCGSTTSRNTAYGIALAKNAPISKDSLVEGFFTAKSIISLAHSLNIEMPICEAIYKITHQNYPIEQAMNELMNRSISIETHNTSTVEKVK